MHAWKFIGWSGDGGPFEIAGVNVWSQKWIRHPEETAKVIDPRYGQSFSFSVYDILAGEQRLTFAAGEFSNCIWGFYTRS
jgi:hypothetical protein